MKSFPDIEPSTISIRISDQEFVVNLDYVLFPILL